MTRMRLTEAILQQSHNAAAELVEDIRRNREEHGNGAVSFVNYYSVSQFFYQTTIVNQSLTGITSWNSRTGVVVPATNDYTWGQIDKSTSNVTDITTRNVEDMTFSDNTTNNASATKHGLAPKVTDTSKFLRGDMTWQTPTDTSGGGGGLGSMYFMASTILTADVATIKFSGFSGFPGVIIKGHLNATAQAWIEVLINGYTDNYKVIYFLTDGSTTSTGAQVNLGMTIGLNNGPNNPSAFNMEFFKQSAGLPASGFSQISGASSAVQYDGNFYSKWTTVTETIRDITLDLNTGSIKEGSYFIVYGVK